MSTLWALRIYGPCTLHELQDRVDDRRTAYADTRGLLDQGLAIRLPDGLIDISPRGREMMESAAAGFRRRAETVAQPTRRSWPYGGGAA